MSFKKLVNKLLPVILCVVLVSSLACCNEEKAVLQGDIDYSGKVDENDIILLQKYIAGSGTFSYRQFDLADVSEPRETLNMLDVIKLQQFAGKLIADFSQENKKVSTHLNNSSDDEILRAISINIIDKSKYIDSLKFSEMFNILDNAVMVIDKTKLSDFKDLYPAARISDDTNVTVFDAMVSVFAVAEILGNEYTEINKVEFDKMFSPEINDMVNTVPWNPLFGENGNLRDISLCGGTYKINIAAYYYSFLRISLDSSNTLFDRSKFGDIDFLTQKISYTDFVKAVTRLHDSSESAFPVSYDHIMDNNDKDYLTGLNSYITSIRENGDNIFCSGKIYYVSSIKGNDDNDGLSPYSPWATLEKASSAKLEPGDGVLFERGCTFRGHLKCAKGVLYSSYGRGDKPNIYGSPQNGGIANDWKLWYDKDNKKIWKYAYKLQDCGGIVFDAKDYAVRVCSYWNGKKEVSVNNPEQDFSIINELNNNLNFYCGLPEEIDKMKTPFTSYDTDMSGDLYLRCDFGNPAAVYSSIEFQCSSHPDSYDGIITCADNVTINNLCVMYGNTVGINTKVSDNVTVKNCIVSCIGGSSGKIGYNDYIPVCGEGIKADGYNNTISSNYVLQCFGGGVTYTAHKLDKLNGRLVIDNNVIDRCMSGIVIDCDKKVKIDDTVSVNNNDIIFSGMGWSSDLGHRSDKQNDALSGNSVTTGETDFSHNGIYVENNRFYISSGSIIYSKLKHENFITLTGNMYMLYKNAAVASIMDYEEDILKKYRALSNDKLLNICNDTLEDMQASFGILD